MTVTVYCGQTVGWIKMPLGKEEGLGPGHIVLDGDPAAPLDGKGHSSPQIRLGVYGRRQASLRP